MHDMTASARFSRSTAGPDLPAPQPGADVLDVLQRAGFVPEGLPTPVAGGALTLPEGH
ncbi:hypothetical protein [Chachezhania sediminis]|uniref:hypothetical protein n=1 Tax=Chachezhania sediminis TaxID=2599291 RepID=UPI00131BF9EF|nr:hypothetical protein [Chachezhania sediminis]